MFTLRWLLDLFGWVKSWVILLVKLGNNVDLGYFYLLVGL